METVTPPAGPSRPRRSPSLAAFLSFVWPGLGQLYGGSRKLAAYFAIPALVLVAVLVALLLDVAGLAVTLRVKEAAAVLAGALLTPSVAAAVIAVVVALGVWRIASILHAWRWAGRRAARTRGDAVVAGILVLAVVGTHAFVVNDAASFYNLGTKINQQTGFGPQETPAPGDSSQASTIPLEPAITPDPNSGRVTILLTGVDWTASRGHALNDTLLVLSFDTKNKKVAMISVPRDTSGFPLYWGGTYSPTAKINALATYVTNGVVKSPDEPMTTLAKEIGFLIGIPVNYYAILDLGGFSKMIDLVGGVDVVNPKPIDDPVYDWLDGSKHGFQLAAGPQHLNGRLALAYVRSRYGVGDSDYTRSSRQQDVLVALEKKMSDPSMMLRISELLNETSKMVRTNFPSGNIRDMIRLGVDLPDNAISKCVLGPPYSFHPDSATTGGIWTSQLKMDLVKSLSVQFFGKDSAYYGQPGVKAAPCGK